MTILPSPTPRAPFSSILTTADLPAAAPGRPQHSGELGLCQQATGMDRSQDFCDSLHPRFPVKTQPRRTVLEG